MRALRLEHGHVVLEDLKVDDLAIFGADNCAECRNVWVVGNDGQSRRARLKVLLLLEHFSQLVATDHALLLTALLIEHLQAQLLAMLVVQRRCLLELRSLSVGQRFNRLAAATDQCYFVYFVLLCSGYQLSSVLTLIAHLVEKVSSMLDAVANAQLHRLHKLEFVVVLVLRLCRFQPDLISHRLKGRLNIDETKVTTQCVLR